MRDASSRVISDIDKYGMDNPDNLNTYIHIYQERTKEKKTKQKEREREVIIYI